MKQNASPAPSTPLLVALLSLITSSVHANPPEQPDAQISAPEGVPSEHWLDTSQTYVADRGDALANWLDDFFGTRSSDIESAHSLLRVAATFDADEREGNRIRYKVRGKLRLPRLKKRFYIVFTGSDDDDDNEDELLSPRGQDDDNQAGLQYEFSESLRSRTSFFTTLNSSLKYKAGVRYRYETTPTVKFSTRFSEELAYQQQDHVISTTRLDLNYHVRTDRMLRWANRVRYGEKTYGVEWNTEMGLQQRIAPTKAITYFVGMNGDTDSRSSITSYGPGVRYRQNIFRKYLFFDVGTAYGWRKSSDEMKRKGAWSFEVQLQMFFENKKKKSK